MADEDFDPVPLMLALDATEGTGVPPHLVEQLRAMVRDRAEGRDSCRVPGPWRHAPIPGEYRDRAEVHIPCPSCRRNPVLTVGPERRRVWPREPLTLHRQQFRAVAGDGDARSPALFVGSCPHCGAWHMG